MRDKQGRVAVCRSHQLVGKVVLEENPTPKNTNMINITPATNTLSRRSVAGGPGGFNIPNTKRQTEQFFGGN